jgi:mannose-6-phosphate isomerase-like protein (cupin superfamily)
MDEGSAPYAVAAIETVAATADLKVRHFTLGVGETIPWHFHSAVTDWYFCLEGRVRVETRAPRDTARITAGQSCTVPVKTAHRVANDGETPCRFLLVQGVGPYDFQAVGMTPDGA